MSIKPRKSNPRKSSATSASAGRKIIVFGATGYTGRAVVERLSSLSPDRTWAHVRPDSTRLDEWSERVASWDSVELSTARWTRDAIREELRRIQPTHIFLLLGTTKARARRGTSSEIAETYEAVDYGLSHLVIEANASLRQPARVLYLSSIGVNDDTANAYLAARAKVEAELENSSLSWVSVRASFISGPDRNESRPMERLSAIASKPFFAIAGALGARDFKERFSPRTADELARLLIDAALDRDLEGVVYLDEIVRR